MSRNRIKNCHPSLLLQGLEGQLTDQQEAPKCRRLLS